MLSNIPLLYTLLFCGTLFFSILINGLFLNFSRNLGIRKGQQDQIRWDLSGKPALGGISFYILFLVGFIFLDLFNNGIDPHFAGPKVVGLLFSVSMAFLMGLADDAFDTKPLIKFAVQCACGLVLIFSGTRIHTFQSEFLNYFITILWVVGIMNSINMIDNMDSIATVVTMVILSFSVYQRMTLNEARHPDTLITLIVLATLCGFLVYNWHPAKIYMGDTGSQFLGVFLAYTGIETCWNNSLSGAADSHFDSAAQILIVSLVFVLPVTDTIVVIINRIRRGQSPFIGGKDHTTHCLFFMGITEKRIAVLFVGINVIGAFLAEWVANDKGIGLNTKLLLFLYPFSVFCIFLYLNVKKAK